MQLNQYFSSLGAMSVSELRKRIGAKSDAQIRQWQHGYAGRRPGTEYCVAIERVTKGLVTRKDLRPNDYWVHWPDLKAPQKTKEAA